MTMATLWPSTRISSGSSAASKSCASVPAEPFIRRIPTSLTRRPSKNEAFTIHHTTADPRIKVCLLTRRYDEFLLRNRVECRLINPQVCHDKFRWSVGQPLRQRKILIVAALEHLQEDQVRVTCILNVMQQRFLHVPDVSRLKVQRASAVASRHHSHASLPTDVILPLVGIGMPVQFPQPSWLNRHHGHRHIC